MDTRRRTKGNHSLIEANFLFVICLLVMNPAQSEVYRWVDKHGKTHFSDKRPKVAADDITAEVSKQNIDTSSEEQRKLEQIFRPENDADREYYRQQQIQNQPTQEEVKRCNEGRKFLRDISGRVQFIDREGKEIKVTERERQLKVENTKHYLEQHCNF